MKPTYEEQVAAEDAALAKMDADNRAQLARMEEDALLFGAGFVRVARQEDGKITVEHVPLSEVHEQMAAGERQAQETVIHANLDENCSPLDADQTRRGKISRLDGQGTPGDISELDR